MAKNCNIQHRCPYFLTIGPDVCAPCVGVATNLRSDCKLCGGEIEAVAADDHYSVRCLNLKCGHVETGRDYLARCVGGASLGGAA